VVLSLAIVAGPVSAQENVTHYPGQDEFGVIMYEDQFPCNGDRDYNDAIVRTNFVVTDHGSGVTMIELTIFPQAVGAGTVRSGLALHLPETFGTPTDAVRFPTGDPSLGVSLAPWPDESDPVYTIWDDVRDAFGSVGGFINTDPAGPFLLPEPVTLKISFLDPVAINPLPMPFDLFFYRSDDRSYQVHLPEYAGTDQMDMSLFNTEDDASTVDRHFVSTSGLPWMLLIEDSPDDAIWPTEGASIDVAFPSIIAFAASGGTSSTDWYENCDPNFVIMESQLPEPATLSLLALGGFALVQRRKREVSK